MSRTKADSEEMELEHSAGWGLGGLRRFQSGGGFVVSFQGGWDLEFSRKHDGEASAGSGRNK